MLLRRFYIQENEKAPVPKAKKSRELKYEFLPLDYSKYVDSEDEFVSIYGEDQLHVYRESLAVHGRDASTSSEDDYTKHPKKRKMSIELGSHPETYSLRV
jgi:tRNA-specific adenosine deaminase 2